MQSLDIISVNIWNILISLVNLYILYRIIKRFLLDAQHPTERICYHSHLPHSFFSFFVLTPCPST